MGFAFTPEQDDLRELARRFLRDTLPLDRVSAIADSEEGWDPSSWPALAEMGWIGLTLPDKLGGVGLGQVEQAIVLEELGRALYAGPYLATVLALPVLPADRQVEVAAGKVRWSVEIDGLVPELDRVHAVVTDGGEAAAEGEALPTIDPTRHVGRLVGGTRSALPRIVDRTVVLAYLAAEALGVAERTLEIAVEYAKERSQFARAIGSYQAIAHPLADSFAEIELARSLVYAAAWKLSTGSADALRAASIAKGWATDAAVTASELAIQVHGGIGFTWEHPLHRFYKRALWLRAFAGHPAQQRAVVRRGLLGKA